MQYLSSVRTKRRLFCEQTKDLTKEYAESHFADDEKDFLVMPYVFCTKQCYRVNNELKF